MVNSAEVRACLTTLEKAEADLAALKAFEAADGRFRISLSVEHPDPQIAEIISRLGKENLSKSGLVGWLVKLASADVSRARDALKVAITGGEVDIPVEQLKAIGEQAGAIMAGVAPHSVIRSDVVLGAQKLVVR